MPLHLVLGGVKSGKTRYALALALDFSLVKAGAKPKMRDKPYYLASCEYIDGEMASKIAAHQLERGDEFITLVEGVNIANQLPALPANAVVVIDNMGMWINNLMHHQLDIKAYSTILLDYLHSTTQHIIIVADELSFAPIAMDKITRQFVNHNGFLNQQLAQLAGQVDLMVAGINVKVK